MIGLIGPTNQACRPIQHLQLGGGGELDKTEICSQIIEYKMILVGPCKYYERKGVLVDIITIKTKRGAEDTGAGRAGGRGGPSPQLFMQKSSDVHPPPRFLPAALIQVLDPNPLAYIWRPFPGTWPLHFSNNSGATDWFGFIGG